MNLKLYDPIQVDYYATSDRSDLCAGGGIKKMGADPASSRLVPVKTTEIELRKLSLYIPSILSHNESHKPWPG